MTTDSGPFTVLVLDDEPDVVTYLEMLLQDAGYKTISARNGREGMEKVKKKPPDLICLDITMPEESGIRFYRNLKEDPELAHIPVVVVTAVTGLGGQPEPFEKFISTLKRIPAPEGFFPKPIDKDQFLRKVKEILIPDQGA
jgi:CheY-like chemotaxis protein